MREKSDFTIECLGERKIPSPIMFASEDNAFAAKFVDDKDSIRFSIDAETIRHDKESGESFESDLIEKAGPRKKIYFNPSHVHAGICTCGGLCPGMNDVIRSVVRTLWHRYGVRRITGIPYGFKGFLPDYNFQPMELTPPLVDNCHKTGGSILGTSRGGGNRVSDIVDGIESLNLNQLFIIGGDGTQHGALQIAQEIERRNLKIAVVGIPKTIDNDFLFIQKSFGFDTAVGEAANAVSAAHMEASSHINGIGLVKLMGRESGFIATATAIASHEVNFCLIPEVPFDLDGEKGFLRAIEKRLEKRDHAVIVVAEGAGQDLLQTTDETDASGNKKLGDIGIFLRDKINEYFKARKIHINLKYIDPSYQIRSAPAASVDSIYCERLGNNAAHAAMAGKTKCVVGCVHNRFVILPISVVIKRRNKVNPESALWRDAIDATDQPALMVNDISRLISAERSFSEVPD